MGLASEDMISAFVKLEVNGARDSLLKKYFNEEIRDPHPPIFYAFKHLTFKKTHVFHPPAPDLTPPENELDPLIPDPPIPPPLPTPALAPPPPLPPPPPPLPPPPRAFTSEHIRMNENEEEKGFRRGKGGRVSVTSDELVRHREIE
ncbi:hypothetical protein GCK72_017557 [Caenorhabditis remanei]|uniref:Uncharacterized protein n=1 Tax=Caenorhabditis remanei TaxID=31234 RepID=A0A6A5G8H5_CAERE|nr:hypothetical protein GCK72_017557 [Caenorhabditis remanei]KAF1751005.1 hypothetical protein GCK72_017557 [Caenorhabditis remanei]